jgi:hypothetical protein
MIHSSPQFLALTKTFFYPTNKGAWAARLGYFLMQLCKHFTARIGMERRGHSGAWSCVSSE